MPASAHLVNIEYIQHVDAAKKGNISLFGHHVVGWVLQTVDNKKNGPRYFLCFSYPLEPDNGS